MLYLEITIVQMSICSCVCVYAPKAINNYSRGISYERVVTYLTRLLILCIWHSYIIAPESHSAFQIFQISISANTKCAIDFCKFSHIYNWFRIEHSLSAVKEVLHCGDILHV